MIGAKIPEGCIYNNVINHDLIITDINTKKDLLCYQKLIKKWSKWVKNCRREFEIYFSIIEDYHGNKDDDCYVFNYLMSLFKKFNEEEFIFYFTMNFIREPYLLEFLIRIIDSKIDFKKYFIDMLDLDRDAVTMNMRRELYKKRIKEELS